MRRAERGDVDAALRFLDRPGGEPPGPGDEVMPGREVGWPVQRVRLAQIVGLGT